MSLKPMSLVRVRMALVLLSLAGAACSDDLPTGTGADIPMTAVSTRDLAAEIVPNTWTRRIRMPTARTGLVAAKVNGIIYAICR